MTSLRKDDGTVAGAEKIVAKLEAQLAVARRELEATARARRPLAYAAALDDAVAARQLATLVKDETAAQTKVRNLELACEMAGAELVAAKEAEIRARRPRYVSDRTRRIGGLTIEPGVEFELLNSWPTEDDVPCNEAAESVVEYIKANSENPRLPSSPWNSVARCIALPPCQNSNRARDGSTRENRGTTPPPGSTLFPPRRCRLTRRRAVLPVRRGEYSVNHQ